MSLEAEINTEPTKQVAGKKFQRQLFKSHLTIAVIGVVGICVLAGFLMVQRTHSLRLVDRREPMARHSSRIVAELQRSLAALRGWIVTGNEDFKTERVAAWSEIDLALAQLEALNRDDAAVSEQKKLKDIQCCLGKLRETQWWIEDIAQTPGNEPAREKLVREIAPVAEQILKGMTACIELERRELGSGRLDLLGTMARAQGQFSRCRNLASAFVDHFEEADATAHTRALDETIEQIGLLEDSSEALTLEQREILTSIRSELRAYRRLVAELFECKDSPARNMALYRLQQEALPLVNRATELLAAQDDHNHRLMQSDASIVSNMSKASFGLAIVVLTVMGAASFYVSKWRAENVAKPVIQLTNATVRMAAGELDEDIPVLAQDQLGQLTESFNSMRKQLSSEKLALLESRQKLERIVDNTKEHAILSLDEAGYVTSWNKGAEKVLGYTGNEIIGRHFSVFYPKDKQDSGWPEKELSTAIQEAGFEDEDWRIRKDGTRFWANVTTSTLNDETGQVIGFAKLVRDLTQRRRADMLFQSSIQAAPVAMLMVDGTGKIVLANPEAESLFGYSSDEIISQPVEMLLPERIRAAHVSLRDGYLAAPLPRPMGAGRDLVALNKNGKEIPVDLGLNPIETDDGTYVIAVVADVSNSRKAERELQKTNESLNESQTILRSLFDQSVNFVGLLTLDGKILDANRTALRAAGLDVESVLGVPFWETPWWEHSAELQERLKNAINEAAAGNPVEFEATHPLQNGDHVDIAFSLKPVRDENGKVHYLIPEGRDITQHKRREAELEAVLAELETLLAELDASREQLETVNRNLRDSEEQASAASRAKSEFLANMSHEIRTPMTAILGYTDILIQDDDPTQESHDRLNALQTIKKNGEHLLSVINGILDLSKIEAGQMDVEQVETGPMDVVREVLSLMRARAEGKNLELKAIWNGKIPLKIKTDPMRLKQCLINLVGNAIKFTEEGSVSVVVRFERSASDESKLFFDVVDTGIGMTEAQSAKLFKAFSQADTSMTRRFGGTGLGLIITKRLAELMGGEVALQSEAGVGSTFSLSVGTGQLDNVKFLEPSSDEQELQKPDSVKEEKVDPKESAETDLSNCRILFAEDGPDNQRLISFLLKKSGADVTVVENGRLAVEGLTKDNSIAGDLAEPSCYDIVLMDMQMPEMDGYTAARLLKEKGCKVPIIALTAHAMSGEREKCLDAGCDDYATKPINRANLTSTINRWWNAEASITTLGGL